MLQLYYKVMGEVIGPLTEAEVREKVAAQEIVEDTLVRIGDEGPWVFAASIKNLFGEHQVRTGRNPQDQRTNRTKAVQRPTVPKQANKGDKPAPDKTRTEHRYPVLVVFRYLYSVMGAVALLFAVLIVVGIFESEEQGTPVTLWLTVIGTVIVSLSLFAVSELIKLVTDVADDIRNMRRLAEKSGDRNQTDGSAGGAKR